MYNAMELEDFFHMPFKIGNAAAQGGAAGLQAFAGPLDAVAKDFTQNIAKMVSAPPQLPGFPMPATQGSSHLTFPNRTLFFPNLSTPYALENFFKAPASGGELVGNPISTPDGGEIQTTIY
jgi:hypothetical protein